MLKEKLALLEVRIEYRDQSPRKAGDGDAWYDIDSDVFKRVEDGVVLEYRRPCLKEHTDNPWRKLVRGELLILKEALGKEVEHSVAERRAQVARLRRFVEHLLLGLSRDED